MPNNSASIRGGPFLAANNENYANNNRNNNNQANNFSVNGYNSNNLISKKVFKKYSTKLDIRYKKNKKNIGYVKNYLQVLKMAKGEFVWVIGDDEILKPGSLKILFNIFKN